MSTVVPPYPRLIKGALAVYPGGRTGTQPRVIVFQYNPEQVRRTLADRSPPGQQGGGGAGGARANAMRVQGPPKETINLTVVLDAADQLMRPDENRTVRDKGLLPAIFLLETLLYPMPDQERQGERMARRGAAQASTDELPAVLAVWGEHRAAPVRITSFSVTEEAFDPKLNPIRVKLELGMEVLAKTDVVQDRVEWQAAAAYQQRKRSLAADHETSDDRQAIGGPLPA